MKKFLCSLLLLSALLSALSFAGCNRQPASPDALKTVTVPKNGLGLDAAVVRCGNDGILSVAENSDAFEITAKADGSASVRFENDYGEAAVFDAVISGGVFTSQTLTPFTPPENSVDVSKRGVFTRSETDQTEKIQKCIDEIADLGGGTVYIPAGNYRIKTLVMRENVSLRLEGNLFDAAVGYDAVRSYAESKNVAILRSAGTRYDVFFINLPFAAHYSEGCGNFLISGGVVELDGVNCAAVFAGGDGITVENTVFRNSVGHTMQIDACRNVTVRNCMFAGYNLSKTSANETIQIESIADGSTGGKGHEPATCNPGEYEANYGITVEKCYFGKSDRYGSVLTAVGHHSSAGGLSCDGFVFRENVVDNPVYCGLHLLNFLNVEITGNRFVSQERPNADVAADAALISLYTRNADFTYETEKKATVTPCLACEFSGIHNVLIKGNDFTLGNKTVLSAIFAEARMSEVGAAYKTGVIRPDDTGTGTKKFSGYVKESNAVDGIAIEDNRFEIVSPLSQNVGFCLLYNLSDMRESGSEVVFGDGVSFKSKRNGVSGILSQGEGDENDAKKRVLTLKPSSRTVTVDEIGLKTVLNVKKDVRLTLLPSEGGRIDVSVDGSGNLCVLVLPDPGFTFEKWVDKNGNPVDTAGLCAFDGAYTAIFGKVGDL